MTRKIIIPTSRFASEAAKQAGIPMGSYIMSAEYESILAGWDAVADVIDEDGLSYIVLDLDEHEDIDEVNEEQGLGAAIEAFINKMVDECCEE